MGVQSCRVSVLLILETAFLYLCINPGILALIIIRTLRRDIARYNKDEEMVCLSCYVPHSMLPPLTTLTLRKICNHAFRCTHVLIPLVLILPYCRMILWKRLAGNLFMEMCSDHPDIQP